MLQKSKVVNYMKTCKEINIAFIPYEQQVIIFKLDVLIGLRNNVSSIMIYR